MDIYESRTPAPFGDTGLIFSDIALMGGIDQIDFLRKAPPEAVSWRVAELAEIASKHGRFILGTSDYISEATPPGEPACHVGGDCVMQAAFSRN
jgi:uroporphyrinogen decarboxylase